jgi:sRNA-binding carbon storage regulator CsrA
MLVLTIKDGERIRLKDNSGQVIHVMLVASGNGRAKLGIEAPKTVEILWESLVTER